MQTGCDRLAAFGRRSGAAGDYVAPCPGQHGTLAIPAPVVARRATHLRATRCGRESTMRPDWRRPHCPPPARRPGPPQPPPLQVGRGTVRADLEQRLPHLELEIGSRDREPYGRALAAIAGAKNLECLALSVLVAAREMRPLPSDREPGKRRALAGTILETRDGRRRAPCSRACACRRASPLKP